MNKFYDGLKVYEDENGYDRVYLPSHLRAHQDGLVYVHILQAEKYLGRALKTEEVVHHIDGNKTNNAFTNLMVFATSNMHTKYHHHIDAGSDCILRRIDKVWYCYDVNPDVSVCLLCGREKDKKAVICKSCYIKKMTAHIPSRNTLIQDLLSLNFVSIGRKYGVSDNAVRKWCKNYGLPYTHNDVKNYRTVYKLRK